MIEAKNLKKWSIGNNRHRRNLARKMSSWILFFRCVHFCGKFYISVFSIVETGLFNYFEPVEQESKLEELPKLYFQLQI